VVYYSDEYGYGIEGDYITVEYAATVSGTRTTLAVYDGNFSIPADGYVFVTGGGTNTCIYPTWYDWIDGHAGNFAPYAVDTTDFSSVMVNFPAGLCAVGAVRDEINFNLQVGISRIERIAYTEENMEAVIESGREWDADTNYIYVVRASAMTYSFSIDGAFAANDHGIEYLTGTTVPCDVTCIYGNNLKNKLETDVLTKSQDLVNNLTSTAKNKALTANQGRVLGNAVNALNSTVGAMSGKLITKTTTAAGNVAIRNITGEHFLFLSSSSSQRYAILFVRVASSGNVTYTAISMGSYVTVLSTAANQITLKFDVANLNVHIYDLAMGSAYVN
jgi:hypothetical protein